MNISDMPRHIAAGLHSHNDTTLLCARSLTVSTASGATALLDLSFELARGRTMGLVGESGAGKSMVGRVISRQLPERFTVTEGTLDFMGQNMLKMSAAQHLQLLGKRIAFIPQEPMTALNPVHTIGEQFTRHLARIGVPASLREARCEAMLAEVKLPRPREVMRSYAFQLSGGMCQRVMIALAFAGDPDLVVSDEATTALDASTQAHIVTLIRGLQERRGTGVIFVTHDLGLAARVCDDVVVLYAGTISESGPARAVFGKPRHPYTQALLRANPALGKPGHRLAVLPGTMPDIAEFATIAGCRFAARCSWAGPACSLATPPLRMLGESRVRCLRPLQGAPDEPLAKPAQAVVNSPMSADPFLVVRGLSKTYPGRRRWFRAAPEVQAVRAVDLSIAPGEFVGIVGESGSGKSTLGRLIMGLEPATEGTITLNNAPLSHSDSDWQRRISAIQMIFQDPRSALNPRRTVHSLVTQAMEARPHLHVERDRRAHELVADVGLAANTLSRYPAQMSGGQRQRVNIGRALCEVPQLLLADEIVSGLDVSVQAQVLNLLLDLRNSHKISLLLISHDLSVVAHLCSRVLVMYKGEVVESGPTQQVFNAPTHAYTRHLLDAVASSDPARPWPGAPDLAQPTR